MHARKIFNEHSGIQDKQFLEDLMNSYGSELTFLAYTYIKNTEDAKDIVQNVFVTAYHHREKLQKTEFVKTWLYRVTINKCKDHLKSSLVKRMVLLGANPEPRETGFSLDQEVLDKELANEIRNSIFSLRIKYREVIMMRFFQELSIKEIATILKLPESTVHTRLRRAKEQLSPILEKEVFINE